MSAATPDPATDTSNHKRSASHSRTRSRSPPPRPTTPLRPPSRGSLRSSHTPTHGPRAASSDPLAALEPAFAELADGMADLEANYMHLQIMHESVARFNECFASFLYGLNVNAFCVDFPEAPVADSFRRARENPQFMQAQTDSGSLFNRAANLDASIDPDQTFLTTDTSFVENPPASSAKASSSSRFSTPAAKTRTTATSTRGTRGSTTSTSRGVAGGRGRSSGLARASARGRGGAAR